MCDTTPERLALLEALADAVRRGLGGLPDHPWIPGARARPVRDALLALDALDAPTTVPSWYWSEDVDSTSWSVYTERYYDLLNGEPIDGTQQHVSTWPTEAAAEAEARRLTAERNARMVHPIG